MKTPAIKIAFLFVFLLSALVSCKEEEETLPEVKEDPNPTIAINNWILKVMKEVYLWLPEMRSPTSNTADPSAYFEALLNRPTDRFSVIYPDYKALINSLSGINLEAGYEFTLYRESPTSNNVVAEITYVKKNSPAATGGMQRGDYIIRINGVQLTLDNYKVQLGLIDKPHTLITLRPNSTSGALEPRPEISLVPVELAENPNFLDSMYTINGEKIGYVVYHFFAPGPGSSSNTYDQEMDAIFGELKSKGVQHLILDFRYNGGGYVSSAVNLASLIGPGVSTTDIFSKTKYNSYLMQFDNLKNVQTPFKAKTENLGKTLKNNRVYVLTSTRTASASELIINGLKPYMDVFLIGDKTTGKNVGSVPFEDEANPKNPYGILPIISRSFNSLDQSEYTNGFLPNIEAKESTEPLKPLGDVKELLLRKAIEQITGIPSGVRIQQLNRQELGSSQDAKSRSGLLIESLSEN
jgi:C-terminal processing protease CtpA/Prc